MLEPEQTYTTTKTPATSQGKPNYSRPLAAETMAVFVWRKLVVLA